MGTSGPRCPNHKVPLTDCRAGVGICPISGCEFEYKADESSSEKELKYDSSGKVTMATKYIVASVDGSEG